MKKFIALFIIALLISGCQPPEKDSGIIREKFIEKIDVKAMMDGLQISSTDADSRYQELYVVKVKDSEDKIYINQFCYEDLDVGDEIVFVLCGDIRFEKEY